MRTGRSRGLIRHFDSRSRSSQLVSQLVLRFTDRDSAFLSAATLCRLWPICSSTPLLALRPPLCSLRPPLCALRPPLCSLRLAPRAPHNKPPILKLHARLAQGGLLLLLPTGGMSLGGCPWGGGPWGGCPRGRAPFIRASCGRNEQGLGGHVLLAHKPERAARLESSCGAWVEGFGVRGYGGGIGGGGIRGRC